MPIHVDTGVIQLIGDSPVEDAETLFGLLRAEPTSRVDLTAAGHLHAAVLQVLLACRPAIMGPPADPFVAAWLVPEVD